jgi:hypothetical protein
MSYRRDEHYERLVEHCADREWSDVQIINLAHKVARSALMSFEGVLEILEYQQQVDEGIAAEKEYDQHYIPQEYFEDTQGFIQARFEDRQ